MFLMLSLIICRHFCNEFTMSILLQTMVMLVAMYHGEYRSQAFECKENRFALNLSSSSESATSPLQVQGPQSKFTICFWMKAAPESRDMTVFSLKSSNGVRDIIMLINSSSVTLQMGSSQKILQSSQQLTNRVVSICLTWRNNDGRCKLFVNSALAAMVDGFSKDFVIKSGSRVYLGGPPNQKQFVGLISHFNIWSHVLPTQVIAILGQRCGVERGDVIPWESFKINLGANINVVQDICSEQAPQWNRTGLAHHWTLNGPDTNVRLNYSAVYLEGRYNNTKSLFLDSTRAYAILKPGINLAGNFTLSFWMKYTSDDDRNATILSNFNQDHKEFIFKILKDALVFQRRQYNNASRSSTVDVVFEIKGNFIEKWTWQHVAWVWQEDMSSYHVRVYIDGRLVHKGQQKPNPPYHWVTHTPTQWDLGRTYESWDYGYFLGYLSDFMVFKRALSDQDIATLMGVGLPVYQTIWKPVFPSPWNPNPTQSSVETWPDIGECTKTRSYQPADCLAALLTGKHKVNFTHESVTVQLPCDQVTNGGGWLVIGSRNSSIQYFNQTIQNYISGFWENDKQFWLGGTIITSLTQQSHQLLVEMQSSKGYLVRTSCDSFRMESTETRVTQCSGYNISLASLADFKNLFLNTSFSKVEVKIRPAKDLPNDFTLYFGPSRSTNDNVRIGNLTKMTSFTICLWARASKHHRGTLFSLVSNDLSCHLYISSIFQLRISCTDLGNGIDLNVFDDKWHHLCITWRGTNNHLRAYVEGKHRSQNTGIKLHVFKQGGTLSIGRHQRNDGSIDLSNDFIGRIGHVHLWDFVQDETFIEALSKGPGTEFIGNILSWALIRAWVPNNIQVLHPSSCTIQETYRWIFKSHNASLQVTDDKTNASAHVEGGIIESDETVNIDRQGSITASFTKNQTLGISMSFWIKQRVLISNILGDNNMYYDQLKTWLSPIISHHASWVRCHSSRLHGYYASSFHNLCDFKGPTITLIKVKGFIFGGMIDQSWGGSSGFLPSSNAFLFTLNNPHQLPPTKFPIKQDHRQFAAHTNQFVGPSFGFNDLTVYEDLAGRLACWSNLGTSYNISNNTVGRTNVFTGSRLFYPDEVEVFFYDLPATKVQEKPSTSFINNSNVFCSSSNALGQYIQWDFSKLETVTHISLGGDLSQGYVTSFLVNYSSISSRSSWSTVSEEFVTRAKWIKNVHALLPPIQAYSMRIRPTKWHKQICMTVDIYKTTQECDQAFGMESKLITNEKITASSTYKTYTSDLGHAEYRWPFRGRLNNNVGAKAWTPAAMKIDVWFQVDLGKVSALRCLALQGNPDKLHFVRGFQLAYSLDGAAWNYVQTNYDGKAFKGIQDQKSKTVTVMPRSVMVKYVRIYPVNCSKFCAMRIEIYGKQSGIKDNTEGLQFAFRKGSNSFIYSTSSNTWKIENKPPLQQWTHVTLTWSPANGIKVYYNGTLEEQNRVGNNVTKVAKPERIALTIAEGVGTTPVKIGRLKVWNQELDQNMAVKDYESINCDFEQGMCLDRFEVSSNQKVSWERSLYCMSTNTTGPCVDDRLLTGYCLTLKSLPVYSGLSSTFTSPLLHSTISCITFHYKISGNTAGRINVNLISLSGEKSLLWRTSCYHSNAWKEGRIPISEVYPFKVEFEGILANDPGKHLSIDNIIISVKRCLLTPTNAVSNTSVIKSKIINHIPAYMKSLKDILTAQNQQTSSWTPCYTSRDHGWNITMFKKLCQSKSHTLALARSRNTIYGGFTKEGRIQECPDSERFSLDFDGQKDFSLVNLTRDITSFSISLWMQTSSTSSMALLSTNPEHLVIKYEAKNLYITLHGSSQTVSAPYDLNDNKWHHIFVQWQHVNQSLSIYVNGVRTRTRSSIKEVLHQGTSFLLGKKSSNNDYYKGKLDSVNVWSYSVDDGVARIMSQGYRHVYHGNVITWKDFKAGIRETTKVVPSTCTLNASKSDYDLSFTSAMAGYVAINSTWMTDLHEITILWWMKTDTYKDLHILSYTNKACKHKNNFGISFTWNETRSKWMFVLDFVKNCASLHKYQERLLIQTQINDGFWHHVAVTWYNVNRRVDVTVDGLLEGSITFRIDGLDKYLESIPKGGKVILGQTPQNSSPDGDLNSNLIYIGRLTDFNIIEAFLSQDALRVLSLRWGSVKGNLLSWEHARHHVIGKVQDYSPSSCRRETYRPDMHAFLFLLNNSSSTVAKIRSKIIEFSTSVQESLGLVYGESPHDLVIGINGSMRTAVYRGNISYEVLDHLDKTSFTVDDIEVLYKKDTLCSPGCLYPLSCDEIIGRCKCTTADTSFGLCDIEQKYPEIQYFWPLDHPDNFKNLKGSTWGVVEGDVTSVPGVNMGALKFNSRSKVVLERFNTSCLESMCEITVSLWLKYWLTNSDQNQTFLDIHGLLTLFQPKGNTMEMAANVHSHPDAFITNIFDSPAGIWNHYTIIMSKRESIIYRNKQQVQIIKRNFTTLSINNKHDPLNGLITLSGGDAQAEYDDLIISDKELLTSNISDIMTSYTDKTIIPVGFSAQFPDETWHDSLSRQDSQLYLDFVERLESNISHFYVNNSKSIQGIKVDMLRKTGSDVIGNFTISYYPWRNKHVTLFSDSISSTSKVGRLTLKNLQITPVLVPNKPLYVKVIKLSNNTIKITWNAPIMDSKTLSYFQGYKVYYLKQGEVNTTKFVVEGMQTTFIMKNPTPYTILRIWVTAFTIKGEGLPSNEVAVSIVTGAPTVIPNITAAYNTSSTSIFVKWTTPTSQDNKTISGYEVVIFRNDSEVKPLRSLLTNCTQATLKELDVFTTYVIQIAAFNVFGIGPYSKPVIRTTDEEVPTGSPSNVTLPSVASRQVHLVWKPISVSDRNGFILGYNVTYHLLNDSNAQVASYVATTNYSHITLKNLRPYSTYRIQITGYNTKGQGPPMSSPYVIRTDEAAPSGSPVINQAISQGSSSILLRWNTIPKPELNGILRYYIVQYHVVNTTLIHIKNVTSSSSRRKRRAILSPQVTLGGLQTFTNYSIKIAGGTVSQGPYSPAVVISTGQDVPGAVVSLHATNHSSTSIRVTWKPPSIPNGIILGYKVNYSDGAGSLGSIDTKLTTYILKGLVNYTLYYIRVTSYTIKGEGNVSTVTCKTDEAVPTGPPQSLSAFPVSTTSIEVKWKPVTVSQQRGIITKYQVMVFNSSGMVLSREVLGNHYMVVLDGLQKRSNYSVKISAFTRKGQGPFSKLIYTSTNSEAPKFVPSKVTAQLNGTNRILVQWSSIAQGSVRGYRVVYTGINQPFAVKRNISVDHWTQEVILQDLYYYTRYSIQVTAYTTIEGNYSKPVYVTTGESVPTHPPTRVVVVPRGSTNISVFWDLIPIGHRNGRIIKYRVEYRKTGTNESFIQETDQYSTRLTGLTQNTRYDVIISGATSAGYGNRTYHSVTTDEDVPSGTPQNLTAQNWTSLYTLPVTWQPVAANHMNGKLTGYYLTYSAVKQGDKEVFDNSITGVSLPPHQTSYTITGLLPLSVYRISVSASTRKGAGPKATTFGETCRCTRTLTTSWSEYHPYVNITDGIPGLIIPVLVASMTSYCCGYCKEYGHSKVDFTLNGNGTSAKKSSLGELVQSIDGKTDFSFPIYGHHDQSVYKGGLGFSPLILSPGVAFIVHKKDTVKFRENMFNAIIGCWPVLAVPIVMCYIAGFIIWVLDSRLNPKHYPQSFTTGIQNGFWWAFVSMTTVGYGDKTPIGHGSRLFAVIWTLCGIVIISICTSTLTTSLTEVTIHNKQMLYGSKVAALHNSPEFWLGKRKNAKVNQRREYHTLLELIQALEDKEVDGILVDTYAAGSRSDLFNKPSLRIAKVLDYKMAYGLVTAGYAIQLRQCFHDYLMAFTADLYHNISNNVRMIEYKQDPPEQIITDGLFNTKAQQFKDSVKVTGCVLLSFLLFGITFDWIRRVRTRAPVEGQALLQGLSKKKEIMKDMINNFKENMERTSKELTKKHSLELIKARKLRNRKKLDTPRDEIFIMQRLVSSKAAVSI